MAYIPGSSLYGVKAFGDTGEAPNATAQPDVVQARASAPTELDKLQPAVQSIERGGNEETIELLKDIRQTQGHELKAPVPRTRKMAGILHGFPSPANSLE
jgi:hypothetical protein